MAINGWDEWLDGTPIEGRSKMPKGKSSYPYQKATRSVDAAGRKDGRQRVPVNYNGSRQMARNPKALLEHPKGAPKRSLRTSGRGVNSHNMQYTLRAPSEPEPAYTYPIKARPGASAFLYTYPNRKCRIVEVSQGVARRSREYHAAHEAEWKYNNGKIEWDRNQLAKVGQGAD